METPAMGKKTWQESTGRRALKKHWGGELFVIPFCFLHLFTSAIFPSKTNAAWPTQALKQKESTLNSTPEILKKTPLQTSPPCLNPINSPFHHLQGLTTHQTARAPPRSSSANQCPVSPPSASAPPELLPGRRNGKRKKRPKITRKNTTDLGPELAFDLTRKTSSLRPSLIRLALYTLYNDLRPLKKKKKKLSKGLS